MIHCTGDQVPQTHGGRLVCAIASKRFPPLKSRWRICVRWDGRILFGFGPLIDFILFQAKSSALVSEYGLHVFGGL